MTPRLSPSQRIALVLLALAAVPALALAGPHPDCTCEFCLENPGAKCTPPGGGVAGCISLIRSGVCLGQLAGGVAAAPVSREEAFVESLLQARPQEPPRELPQPATR